MLPRPNLVVDSLSEVYKILLPWRTHEFWEFSSHDPIPDSIYILGRQQYLDNREKFCAMALDPQYTMIFNNSAEGSEALVSQLNAIGLEQLVLDHNVLLISGGEMDSRYPYMLHDHFLEKILDYDENVSAMQRSEEIYTHADKPYNFLFLNGRSRPHRKYIWERLNCRGLLDRSLWTMLDSRPIHRGWHHPFNLRENDVDIMATTTPLQRLPREYEVEQFRDSMIGAGPAERTFIKPELFKGLWGEIYLVPEVYRDTYFSLVTETVFDYPYSFRTEKIAKELVMGHPWICATSNGFYRDIRNLGFKTFEHLIDESFDSIDNHQDRMDRIIDIVGDLCNNSLSSFLAAAQEVCKYNQQHLIEMVPRIRSELPPRFFNFINQHRE